MSEARILVVDDDEKIRLLLRNCLEPEGFEIHEAATAEDVWSQLASDPPDLITLDINLGADDGFELARQIRKSQSVPIIMLSGKFDVIDKIVGLELGADDYITKPFHVREVLARVRSVLRRSQGAPVVEAPAEVVVSTAPARCVKFDGMVAYPDSFELIGRDGTPCNLTSGDFKLLDIFLNHPRRILSRERLMDLISGIEWSPLDRAIDNQVARLRKKIERDPGNPKLIKTVRGVGYTFTPDIEACP
ncbi:MAG: response regulator transcription factor [Paracoccaceae bacterium]